MPRKIGALGLRVERGVTYHGIALNVNVALADFDLIDPCGMPGLASASIASESGRRDEPPGTEAVATAGTAFAQAFARAIDAPLGGDLPGRIEPAAARVALERLLGGDARAA